MWSALLVALLTSTADPEADARAAFEEGVKAYNLADFDTAIAAFKRGYEITGASRFLYNIAQAYRQKGPGSCKDAAHFYRSFLRGEPATKDRALIESRLPE